jgi:hypothetical protein
VSSARVFGVGFFVGTVAWGWLGWLLQRWDDRDREQRAGGPLLDADPDDTFDCNWLIREHTSNGAECK